MKLLEKVKNTKNKKKVAAAIIAMAIVLTAGTIALLSQVTQAANNNFKGAVVNVGVVEGDNYDTTYEQSINNSNQVQYPTMTNDGVEKKVAIKNINSIDYPTTDTYVRVRLVPKLVWNDGTEYAGQTACENVAENVDYGSIGADWYSQSTNGETYYYYTSALAPDAHTSDLISNVKYTGTIPTNQHFELEVLTEGIAAYQHTQTSTNDFATAWNAVQSGAVTITTASTEGTN